MRIVTVSDLHIGKESWGDFGIRKSQDVAKIDTDVLYFGGDLAEPNKKNPQIGWENFRRGLELLSKSSAQIKIFTLGNNDLEQLRNSRLTEHYNEMRECVGEYSFHLLDDTPLVVGDVAFVGNVGWYDGTLWWKFLGKTNFPNDADRIRQDSERYFREQEFPGKLVDNLTSVSFYQHCRCRLTKDLDEAHSNDSVKAVVLGIHFVPSKSFLRGDNPQFSFLNWYMGAEAHADHYQREKVILGFTGHTHHSDVRTVGNLDVHNLSGLEQPRVFEVQKNASGIYETRKVDF